MNSSPKKLKALVVEDQELFRDAAADELEFLGFKTSKAADGAEALHLVKNETFDLILSDMRMPNKDGRWLLNEVRKLDRTGPSFIFMTGFTDLSPREAFAMGADAFIGKPLNPERLHSLIAKLTLPLEERWKEEKPSQIVHMIRKQGLSFKNNLAQDAILIGRGGMVLTLEQDRLRIGDNVAFDLQIEGGSIKQLEGKGRIVWSQDLETNRPLTAYGIDFESIEAQSLAALIKHIKEARSLSVIPQGVFEA